MCEVVARPAILTFVFVFLGFLAVDQKTRAASDLLSAARGRSVELLVFEHRDCVYCRVFRSDTLPRYRESENASKAPIRFVSIEHTDTTNLKLSGAIQMVPTFVLMQDGREVGRIAGYWAPDNFFKMLSNLMLRTDD
jgi:thioredoxin-related protein